MSYGFLWTGPGLPGTWPGAQYKHVHKSVCIWLYFALFLVLFVKLHIWNRSTEAWNPIGGKAVYCHWCIVIHQESMGTLLLQGEIHPRSLVCLFNSTCSQRKRHWRTRSSALLFCRQQRFDLVGWCYQCSLCAAENSVLSRQPFISKVPHRKGSLELLQSKYLSFS